MLKNFLKIAFRNLARRKGHSLLNIFGLAIGITCCLLIFDYTAYQRSYDCSPKDADQIVRVQLDDYQNGKLAVKCAANYPALAAALKKDFPEVENTCRFYESDFLLSNDARNLQFRERKVYYAEPAALEMFSIQLLKGDPKTALDGPDKILVSETTAKKYFGQEEALGKVLSSREGGSYKRFEITGVFKDYPSNSHLRFDLLVSYATLVAQGRANGHTDNPAETSWFWTDFYTYVKLKKGIDWRQVAAKLPAFADRHINNLVEYKTNHDSSVLQMMPLKDIHLYSHYTEEMEANGDGQSVSFLFMIAFFIITIAWINYTNLATARSLERAREVGVRKVLGALRGELIGQFLTESLLLNGVALLIAIAFTLLAHPFFNQLTGRSGGAAFSLPAIYWERFACLFLAGSFLSGIYPAFVLSRYHPVAVLKGLFKNASGGQWLRKGLIVGQFAASIILIAGTVIVFTQVHYMRNQKLGVDINQTLVLDGATSLHDSVYSNLYRPFKDELLRIEGVKAITTSSSVMGREIMWSTNWHRMRGSEQGAVNLFHLAVDYDFIPNYGLKIVSGRGFSRDFATDKKAVMLNESAVKALGFRKPELTLGELLHGDQGGMDSVHVIGVFADYHQEGLQKAIQPLVMLLRPEMREVYSVKVSSSNMPRTIEAIKKVWARYFAGDPFNYFFLDEFFNQQYGEDRRFGQVFALFAFLAITIACFGLLGLSAYNVLQRTKEIGIRKVLGAPVKSLLYILSRDFLVLVMAAFLIAVPVSWLVMNSWLQEYAYRITISWWVFAIAGGLALFIAMITVGFQALKAALANPVESLRTE